MSSKTGKDANETVFAVGHGKTNMGEHRDGEKEESKRTEHKRERDGPKRTPRAASHCFVVVRSIDTGLGFLINETLELQRQAKHDGNKPEGEFGKCTPRHGGRVGAFAPRTKKRIVIILR